MTNRNQIITDDFSNPRSEALYRAEWPDEPEIFAQYEDGQQCGGCAFYAPFNADYGLCCNTTSRHVLETVFEHFTCPSHVNQGWGAHSFHEPFVTCDHCGGFGDTICAHCAGAMNGQVVLRRLDDVRLVCWHDGCRALLDDPIHMELGASPAEHAFVPAPGLELSASLTEPPTCPHCGISLGHHPRGRECPPKKPIP